MSNGTPRIVGDDEARFWSYVDRRSDDECWPWKGGNSFRLGDDSVSPREYAYRLFVGPFPVGHHVEHNPDAGCAGGSCVNWRRHLRSAGLRCRWCDIEFPDHLTGRHRPPSYCSAECRKFGGLQRSRERDRQPYGKCDIESCAERKRSRRAKWCEMHYGRWRRNGDPLALVHRTAGATCHHCGDPLPVDRTKRLFCSEVCRRRDRLGVPGKELSCVVCDAELAEDVRLDALFCAPSLAEVETGARSRCKTMWERSRLYGLTIPQLRELLEGSTGCAICGRQDMDLHIDHCHVSGQVRALLCAPCNTGLGLFRENPDVLRAAARYVEEHHERRVA